MSVGSFIYGKLNSIATTSPAPAPLESEAPYIIYSIDGQEKTAVTNGSPVINNYVTVTAYAVDYDSAMGLYESIKTALSGAVDVQQGIMGVVYGSMSNGYDGEPIDLHSVTLEFSIYER